MQNQIINALEVEKTIQKKLFAFNGGKTLARAWNAGENCLLTGAGGYGKTDGAYAFFQYLKDQEAIKDENPYILAFGQGMTEERLFAGLDIKKFQEEGELIYNLKKAFVAYEFVIFEEMFDAFPGVLLILKDVLQSKQVRLGDTVYPLRTKFIVACTNRSYDEIVTDRSTGALMERFVFQKEIGWSSWEKSDYLAAFVAATGNKSEGIMEAVATIAAASSRGENKISPRTAGKGLKAVIQNGNDITVLEDILGFDYKIVKQVYSEQESLAADKNQSNHVSTVVRLCNATVDKVATINSAMKIAIEAKNLNNELIALKALVKRDACKEQIEEAVITIQVLIGTVWVKCQSIIINPKKGSLVELIKSTTCNNFDWGLIRN